MNTVDPSAPQEHANPYDWASHRATAEEAGERAGILCVAPSDVVCWFAVQLRYAYLAGDPPLATLVEDRVILVDGEDEEAALGRAVEMAPEYEDEYETDEGQAGMIRFEGIVAIKELDDPPSAGTEVWHEFNLSSLNDEYSDLLDRSRGPYRRCIYTLIR